MSAAASAVRAASSSSSAGAPVISSMSVTHRGDLDLAVGVRRVEHDGGQLVDAGPGSRRVARQRLVPRQLGERLLEDRGDAQAARLGHGPDAQLRGLAEPADRLEGACEHVEGVDMVTTGRQVGIHGHRPRAQLESRLGVALPAADVAGPTQDRGSVAQERHPRRRPAPRSTSGTTAAKSSRWRASRACAVHPGAGERGVAGLVEIVRPEVDDALPLPGRRLDGVACRRGSGGRDAPAELLVAVAGGGPVLRDLGGRRIRRGGQHRGHLAVHLRSLARDEPCADRVGDERVPEPDLRAVSGGEQPLGVQLAQPGDGVERRDLGQLAGQQGPVGNPERSGDRPAVRHRARAAGAARTSASRSGSGTSSGCSASCSVKSGWPRLRAWIRATSAGSGSP